MKTKQLFASVLFVTSLLLLTPRAASANSAPKFWYGADAYGSVVVDKDCPITVEHELLTFDIPDFPTSHGKNNNYNASVTAQYTFFNPTDEAITARLEFPFGEAPNYSTESDDLTKYDITVNGAAIEKTVRHTLMPKGHFELDRDISQITDGFMKDDFFKPDLPVTKYVFEIADYDENYTDACVAFDFITTNDRKFLFMEMRDCISLTNGYRLFRPARTTDKALTVYVFGAQFSSPPKWSFYTSEQCSTRIDGAVELKSAEEMTFGELAESIQPESPSLLEADWYNAVVNDLNYHSIQRNHCIIDSPRLFNSRWNNLMRWYEYEITIPPGERILNTVTAPIYPSIDEHSSPSVYKYTYLLSPAQSWADFGSLDIVVNTPYYLKDNSAFEKTENGYKASFDGLPDGELEFSLKDKNGAFFVNPPSPDIPEPWGAVILIAILAAVIAGIVFLIVSGARRRKRK